MWHSSVRHNWVQGTIGVTQLDEAQLGAEQKKKKGYWLQLGMATTGCGTTGYDTTEGASATGYWLQQGAAQHGTTQLCASTAGSGNWV